ncbi:hypothetical protein Peur_053922 [Populus x canadensis]
MLWNPKKKLYNFHVLSFERYRLLSQIRYTQVMYLVLQFLVLLFLLLTAQQNLMHEFYYPQSLLMVIIQTYLVIHH